jgi:hypothetical protein
MLVAAIVSLGVASYSSASAKEPEHRREQEAMRCKKILDCQPPRGRISAIDLAVGPDVLPAESPSKVASPLLSVAAEENPTSADWPPWDSS